MQVYFVLPYKMASRSKAWSKKSFDAKAGPVLAEATEVRDMMNDCRWWNYQVLFNVETLHEALVLRKRMEAACKEVNSKCAHVFFHFHRDRRDLKIADLFMDGKLREEHISWYNALQQGLVE